MFDLSIFIGIIGGWYLLSKAIGFETGIQLFYHPSSLLIVAGGTFCATMVHFPITQLFKLGGRLKVLFTPRGRNYKKDIEDMIRLASKFRSDSRLALEKELPNISDHFLKHGIELLIDNVDPEEIKKIMQKNITYIQSRHDQGIHFFDQLAQYAPGFGFLGTLIGLVLLLAELDNPSNLGPSMSTALVTTFYGIFLSNLIFLPLAGRLRIASDEEVIQKQMLIEGLECIAKKQTNYMIFEKMSMCLPDKERKKLTIKKSPSSDTKK